ncbi:cytochrome C oxidase subunit I [Streptomyces sp. NPDC093707]|uniref:cytochrome C oxidase subunit I n=1 Tax=Streptomyces sp. NPDC093707 TaxID=3154984 RepID=UPI00344BD753
MTDSQVPDARAIRAGIATMEGYLLWQAEIDRARSTSEALLEPVDWLTTAQREELTDLLTRQQLDHARSTVTRLATRSLQMRRDYEDRYHHLKRRVLGSALALSTAVVSAVVLADRLLIPA